MKLFKVSGKFEQNGSWSDREADFVGYFVKRLEDSNGDVIEGYLEEQFDTPHDKIRYIKGLYMEDLNQLIFLKMINSDKLAPLVYAFNDISKEGYWDGYDVYYRLFYDGSYRGHARIKLEEITDEVKKLNLIPKVISTYEERALQPTRVNWSLMKQTYALVDLLKPPFYPND